MDHVTSEQNKVAMACLIEERARSAKLPMASFAPISSSLQSTLDPGVKEKEMKKFEITFCLVKENLPFTNKGVARKKFLLRQIMTLDDL